MSRTWKPAARLGIGNVSVSNLGKDLVRQVLESNRLTYGPMSREYEEQFSALHGRRYGVISNSGTSSLHVALAALAEVYDWRPDDEILIPAVTFIATANVVLQSGFTPVLIDVDPVTFNIDPSRIQEALTNRTRAIIPVHLCGLPAEMNTIMSLAQENALRVIEDSCEAALVRIHGQPVGSFGDIGCFSTYAAHLLVTGIGGMSITDDVNLSTLMRSLCNHGRNESYISIDDNPFLSHSAEDAANLRFRFDRIGFSYRVTEMEAALGLAALTTLNAELTARRVNADKLTRGLSPLVRRGILKTPTTPDHTEHAFMFYPIVLSEGISRDALLAHLEHSLIETRPLMPLITQSPIVSRLGDLRATHPVAAELARQAFYIGCHPGFGDKETTYVIDVILNYFL